MSDNTGWKKVKAKDGIWTIQLVSWTYFYDYVLKEVLRGWYRSEQRCTRMAEYISPGVQGAGLNLVSLSS